MHLNMYAFGDPQVQIYCRTMFMVIIIKIYRNTLLIIMYIHMLDILEFSIRAYKNCTGVSIHWTGLLDWNTGLDYWTGVFYLFRQVSIWFLSLL